MNFRQFLNHEPTPKNQNMLTAKFAEDLLLELYLCVLCGLKYFSTETEPLIFESHNSITFCSALYRTKQFLPQNQLTA